MEGLLIDVPFKKGDEINLTVYSDLHLGAISCAKKKLVKHMDKRAALPNARFALIGDFGDWIVSRSDPRYMPGQSTAGNRADIVNATKEEIAETLGGYPWDFAGIGNHEHSLLAHGGTDVFKLVMQDLGNPQPGMYSGFARYRFIDPVGTGAAASWNLLYHHGFGGGRSDGPPPALMKWAMAHRGFDAVAYGHNHKTSVVWKPFTYMSGKGRIKHTDVPFVNTGTFSREETQNEYPGYGERAGYPAVTLGAPLWKLRPDRNTGQVKVSVETGDC